MKLVELKELENTLNKFIDQFENSENLTIVDDIMKSFLKPFYDVS